MLLGYTCSLNAKSGPNACPGIWINEREVVNLPVLAELIQKNLRGHLMSASNTNLLHSQVEGEIEAELAKIEQSMRNLIDAVKQGALSMEQIREENGELQDAKRRLEKRLQDLQDRTRVAEELSAVLETFDHNLHSA